MIRAVNLLIPGLLELRLSTWCRKGCVGYDRTEKAGPYWLKTWKSGGGGGQDQEIHPHVTEIKQPITRCFNVLLCLCLKIKTGDLKVETLIPAAVKMHNA